MKIHHLRNATMLLEVGSHSLLVDPMLSKRGKLPPFSVLRQRPRANPIVDLPEGADLVLQQTTHCLITHANTFGIPFLQHSDHLDTPGERFLQERNIPVITSVVDGAYLKKKGLNVCQSLEYWQTSEFIGGRITAVPAQHGHGWIHKVMANGAGFFIEIPSEPSLFISGDTVLTPHVKRALTDLKPDVAVVAAGRAQMDVGKPLLMSLDEVVEFATLAPGVVVANHLEALNHCPIKRSDVLAAFRIKGLVDRLWIPNDGESKTFNR